MTTVLIRRAIIGALLILTGLLFGSLLLVNPGHTAGQSGGNVQLATAVQNLVFNMTATQLVKPITANIGQTAHQLTYLFSGTPSGCSFRFVGSNDNSNFTLLAAGSDLVNPSGLAGGTVVATGYFPYLEIKANPLGSVGSCNGRILNIFYTGSQAPFAVSSSGYFNNYSFTGYFVSPATLICPLGTGSCGTTFLSPFIFGGITCNNTTAGVAFLRVLDSAAAPNLASSATKDLLNIEIAANSTYTYSGNPIFGYSNLWIAGTTTYNGSTGASANELYCTVFTNGTGPFTPFYPFG